MKKIRVCSMCGALGEQAEAADEVAYRVMNAAKVDMRFGQGQWRIRVWICGACETPLLELYPERMAQSKRRALLGLNPEPLAIEEGG